jgi:hypothetical protein
VNRLYRRLPQSTEQVLHPEKYWRRERPDRLALRPPSCLSGWPVLKEDALGELQLRLLLGGRLSRQVAERAAAGWGGDRIAVVKNPLTGDLASLQLSRWDSPSDAVELANALRRSWIKSGLTPAEAPPPPAGQEEREVAAAAVPRATRSLTPPPAKLATGRSGGEQRWIYRDPSGRWWGVILKGELVLALRSLPRDRFQCLLGELWSPWRVNGRPVRGSAK